MPINDNLGSRIKENYENIPKTKLMRRCPVIIRLDGRAFHTFTKGFNRPFDDILSQSMKETTKYLCENIQGAVLGYTQSDEISILLTDYATLETDAWFDYEVQKLCSISASMATMAFNKAFTKNAEEFMTDCAASYEMEGLCSKGSEEYKLCEVYQKAIEKGAMFDARCFNIPKEEVANYFYWRQLDAMRNSIQMVGQANFSHRELQFKSTKQIISLLETHCGINWHSLPIWQQRGSACIKHKVCVDYPDGTYVLRNKWKIDNEIPIFKDNGREYIEELI